LPQAALLVGRLISPGRPDWITIIAPVVEVAAALRRSASALCAQILLLVNLVPKKGIDTYGLSVEEPWRRSK